MNESLVLYEITDRLATITINRPEKRNALNPALVTALTDTFNRAANDDSVKIIILKANGSCFSAGADLEYLLELQNNSYEENLEDSKRLKTLFTTILNLPKLVIAQVEGHAIAGGCGLATVCDLVFSVPEANFGYTEVKLGFVPAIVSCLLMRKTSETIAKQILFSGELFSANQALSYNLINFVTNKTEINQTVKSYALQLCENSSSNSLAVTKQLLNKTTYRDIDNILNEAVVINAKVRESDDFKKGVSSFINKLTIKW